MRNLETRGWWCPRNGGSIGGFALRLCSRPRRLTSLVIRTCPSLLSNPPGRLHFRLLLSDFLLFIPHSLPFGRLTPFAITLVVAFCTLVYWVRLYNTYNKYMHQLFTMAQVSFPSLYTCPQVLGGVASAHLVLGHCVCSEFLTQVILPSQLSVLSCEV